MGVPRYSTPKFTLDFAGDQIDLTQATSVYVTFTQEKMELTKTGEDLDVQETKIIVWLTQEETAKFRVGELEIMANMMIGGKRVPGEIRRVEMTKNLLNEVIS